MECEECGKVPRYLVPIVMYGTVIFLCKKCAEIRIEAI